MITKPVPLSETWAAMEELVQRGKAKSIGVSNFNQKLLEELLCTCVLPLVAVIPH
jgi:diketogulonate reductase-like aldo/keto reductase